MAHHLANLARQLALPGRPHEVHHRQQQQHKRPVMPCCPQPERLLVSPLLKPERLLVSPLQLLEVHVVAEAQLAPVASLEALVGPAVVGKDPCGCPGGRCPCIQAAGGAFAP